MPLDCIHCVGCVDMEIGSGQYKVTVPGVECNVHPHPVSRTMCTRCLHYERVQNARQLPTSGKGNAQE